jgi:hypothetical protein
MLQQLPKLWTGKEVDALGAQEISCPQEMLCLHLLEANEWEELFQDISHLHEAIDSEFAHPVISSGYVPHTEHLANPEQWPLVPGVLIETDCAHEALLLPSILSLLDLEH